MMTPERWQQVKGVLQEALELAPEQRLAFLDRACSTDRSLRREVESLIVVNEQIGTRFPSACPILDEALFRLLPGKRIGPYEILEEVAHGGMGLVYRAVRADGEYKQQVAVKIVRAELDAELTATRFRNERQILASLDHPNIAKILDGGTTADGIPYFVMEFVPGLPITEYCDRHKLSIDSRLEIFRTVCASVHYAHQHLVIHRDLKPSNILITAEGIPKLLDFGIAKILDPSLLPENTTMTAGGLWLMTPEYASPEQLSGEVITTSTDIYSLGLILYQLLTGHHAYRFPSRLPHEITRFIFESEPAKPSTAVRLAGPSDGENPGKIDSVPEMVSGSRGTSPERLRRRLVGDLDNIALKAIRKEPRERYNSVEQLAEDIRRHLEGLPVTARKATVSYRFRKYALRHKVGLAAAALIFLSLLTGMALAVREALIAERRFNDVRKLANSLIFELHDSIRDLPGATAARKLILLRAQEYLDSLARESKSDPALLRELAEAYARLASVYGNGRDANVGNTAEAVRNYHNAVALLEASVSLKPADRDTRLELAQTYVALGVTLGQAGDKIGNKEVTQKALKILESLTANTPNDLKTQSWLGEAYAQAGFISYGDNDLNKALDYHQRALEIYQRLAKVAPGNESYQMQLAFSHKRVAGVQTQLKQFQAALEHERAALQIDESQLALHPGSALTRYNITFTYNDMGVIFDKQEDFDAALDYYRKAFTIRAALAAADPLDVKSRQGLATSYNNIGWCLREKGDFAGALDSFKRSLAIRQALAQKDPSNESFAFNVAFSQANIGGLYAAMASRTNTPPGEQVQFCRESKKWNQEALPLWLKMKSQGKVVGQDLEAFRKLTQNVKKCDDIIARLSHSRTAQ